MIRTLILFGTRKGTTATTAEVLAETLILKCNHQVEMVNIRHKRTVRNRLHEFDLLIIGSSIVSGRWKSGVLRFLKRTDLADMNIALFVTAGGTMNKVEWQNMTREEAREEAITKYIDKYLDKFHFVPVSKTAFGGMVIRSGREKYNSWKREDIESWALQLGELFTAKAKVSI